MSTSYTHENYTPSVLPNGLHQDFRDAVLVAVGLGWKVHVAGMRVTIQAPKPNEKQTIKFSASAAPKNMNSVKRKISKYANPLLMPDVDNPRSIDAHADRVVKQMDRAEAKRTREAVAQAEQKIADKKPIESSLVTARYIMAEGPMIAHRSQGRGYPSPTTIERRWSDGEVDYACAYEGCDYTATGRMGVSSHWRAHGVPADRYRPASIVTPPHDPAYKREGYTPRADRVAALARVLQAALESGDIDWSDPAAAAETLAAEALAWAHEQSTSSGLLAAEREPLTAEERLDMIRNMLDDGLYLSQRNEIADLRARTAELEAMAEEAETARQAAEDDLQAIHDLTGKSKKEESA